MIITSDHGELICEHNLLGHHGHLYEELCHVPLLLKYPDGRNVGAVDSPVSHVDLLPTIAELIGLDWPQKAMLQGRSLVANSALAQDRILYAEDGREAYHTNPNWNNGIDGVLYNYMRATWRGDQKYVWKDNGVENLFDLKSDPQELNNLMENNVPLAAELKGELNSFFANAPYGPDSRPNDSTSDEDKETLKALGYIQ